MYGEGRSMYYVYMAFEWFSRAHEKWECLYLIALKRNGIFVYINNFLMYTTQLILSWSVSNIKIHIEHT
jgi:hypothetical protein